jgi:thiamine-phosphate pyrophosphorylase
MLYALVDQETLDQRAVSLDDLLRHINSLSISILQYRNKTGSFHEKRSALENIRKYYSGKVIINDTVELIDEADGLHLGQEDMQRYGEKKRDAVEVIRQRIGRKILGLSTHSAEEIEEANSLDIDYIGLGAYRSTGTKKDAEVKGDALLEIAKLSRHPVAIIGGVRLDDRFDRSIAYQVVGSDLYGGML